jgi:hypothetical protein
VKKWPENNRPASFKDIVDPLHKTLVQALSMLEDAASKKDMTYIFAEGLKYDGLYNSILDPIQPSLFSAEYLYEEEKRGHDPFWVILSIAVQLGMEQGRRCGDKAKETK